MIDFEDIFVGLAGELPPTDFAQKVPARRCVRIALPTE